MRPCFVISRWYPEFYATRLKISGFFLYNKREGKALNFNEDLATPKQKEYIKALCEKNDRDPDNYYNFATMTKKEASGIIDELLGN